MMKSETFKNHLDKITRAVADAIHLCHQAVRLPLDETTVDWDDDDVSRSLQLQRACVEDLLSAVMSLREHYCIESGIRFHMRERYYVVDRINTKISVYEILAGNGSVVGPFTKPDMAQSTCKRMQESSDKRHAENARIHKKRSWTVMAHDPKTNKFREVE
jgi:hypothetical protein